MARIVNSLAELPQYRALLCDIWGCVHNGLAAFPEAVAALQAYRAKGGRVILVTNSPRPASGVVAQLAPLGVPRDAWDDIVTSGDAAQFAMLNGAVGRRVYHIGASKDATFFEELTGDLADLAARVEPITRVPLDQAEGIVCTGLFDEMSETPDDYSEILAEAHARGLKLLCANPDIEVDIGDRREFCAGAIAQAYDRMGGTSLYFGKPHNPIYALARHRLAALDASIGNDETLCIGDGILTDVQGGVNEGIASLFITSGLAASHFGDDTANPDADLLDRWLIEQSLNPTYAIGNLR
ncbi:TIGR01459 family HAD-type hydrolase [Falsirhodobacter sp. alg1]|uniref:TIGR01459 family HAD-type hydrolase n=1 Tax=Falsirhodobacter sp. alg1 TaxID=1472418 RepID=UPI0005ED734D|nr:TIGR01459 family HAD-type hydrolase [Falsirhodobacter sp. alg1]